MVVLYAESASLAEKARETAAQRVGDLEKRLEAAREREGQAIGRLISCNSSLTGKDSLSAVFVASF